MMVYALLRAIARVALRWYYRDIQVEGLERLPRERPVLLVVNHPNALVDALLVGWVVPRRVRITAKSTLFTNPVVGRLLRWIGVVPLHRTSDVAELGVRSDPMRNRNAFRAVRDALRDGGTVLIFPEGKSHDEPALAPLKSGAARMALYAAESGGVTDLAIVPIGLTFERKEEPRSRVLVQIGEPIVMSAWRAPTDRLAAEELTAEIEARLRAVTLNFASSDDAARSIRLASVLAALFDDVPNVGHEERGFGAEATLARRIDEWAVRLQSADPELRAQADALVRRLEAVQHEVAGQGIVLEDVGISLRRRVALRFIAREGWLLLIGGPIALWGRINHWLPFRAARALAMRSVESATDPAMRTVLAGAALVLLAYLAQTLAVAAVWGPMVAGGYLVSLPIAADINFYLSERIRRAACRARAYLRFRRDRELQRRLADELTALRRDVIAFEHALETRDVARRA
jgi:1-acyl-sn-glycerol-3-phosphate acyltransferase